jgi:transcriptional regulator with AAA-type ATPase domain
MKPGAPAVPALPAPSPPRGRDFIFPERATPARLRQLRDRLAKRGLTAEALQVARRLAEIDPGRESYWKLGSILRDAGAYRGALKVLRDALRFDVGPAYLLPEIHLQLADVWYRLNDSKRMGESLRRAYALRPKQRSNFNLHLSFCNFYLTRRKYREALVEARQMESAAGSSLQRAKALTNQAVVHWNLRELAEAGRRQDQAIEQFKRAKDIGRLARARRLRSSFYFDQGQVSRALGMLERAIPTFERCGDQGELVAALVNAGYMACELGDWSRSLAFLDRAGRALRKTESRPAEICGSAVRSIVLANLGRFEEAGRCLEEARRLAQGERNWVTTLHLCRARARIAALFENWTEVRRWARSAERLACKVDDLPRIVEFRRLRARAEEELGRRRAALHARTSAERLRSLGGQASPVMRRLLQVASRLATSDVPVLLVGEDGTGKTQLAKELHLAGRRAKGPCIVAPCEQLAFPASDLMGHVAGAWSGARTDSPGLAGRARGGTLILDRVDELKPEDQRALVSLAEGRVRAVGSTQERPLDARVLATCRDVRRLVPELRSRLAGALLELPPLRKRVEDVPALVRRMLSDGVAVTADALGLLARHPWPGNLTELRSKVELLAANAGRLPIGVKAVKAALSPPKQDRRERQRRRLAEMAAALR